MSHIVPVLSDLRVGYTLGFRLVVSARADEHKARRGDICDYNLFALALMLLIFSNHCHCGFCHIWALDLYIGLRLDFLLFLDHMLLIDALILNEHVKDRLLIV